MIRTGKFKFNIITGEDYEVLQFEEKDFDFSKKWDDLETVDKAKFCSFVNHPTIFDETISMWEYFQLKQELEIRAGINEH